MGKSVLNALRHQRFRHCEMATGRTKNISCSTPYGIKGLGIIAHEWVREHIIVLNALRHQRFRHRCTLHQTVRPDSAQRLTASKVQASPQICGPNWGLLCSTPYGIKGLGMLMSFSTLSCWTECSTPYGIKGLGIAGMLASSIIMLRAQRLTASKVQAFYFGKGSKPRSRRAQRLTASKVQASFNFPSLSGLLASAQRLTASKVQA